MDFFGDISNIDLREELKSLLYGSANITPIGREIILRKVTDVVCSCWDGVEGGPRTECGYCKGEGYKFREYKVTMFVLTGAAPIYKPGFLGSGQYPQGAQGYTDPDKGTAYCEYSVFPDYERYRLPSHKSFDKLFELKVNPDGSTFYPLVRAGVWRIFNVVPIHGDFGRIEFFELTLEKVNVGGVK